MGEVVPVTAAGGILFTDEGEKGVRILLIYRRNIWDLPKGKLEKGETVEECAQREVAEEVGSPLPRIFDKVATTYHEYREGGDLMGKTTHWFPMTVQVSGRLSPQKEEGIQKVEWVTPSEAKRLVGFPNLGHVIDRFEEWYQKRGHGS